MHLEDLGSKSLQPEIHIKGTNAKGDSSMAAAVIHWLLGSYASVNIFILGVIRLQPVWRPDLER